MDLWLKYVLCIIGAYLVGSVNSAVIISKFRKSDIKKIGSGNPGTMNMLRSVGKFWGCLTFVLDFFKGVAMSLVGMYVFKDAFHIYLLGAITVFGHVFSCFLKFKGGKGVATCLGVFGVANPIAMIVGFVSLLLFLVFCKKGAIGSLLCIFGLTLIECILEYTDYRCIIVLILLFLLVLFTHRGNIKRIIKGEENSLSLWVSDKKLKEQQENSENNEN